MKKVVLDASALLAFIRREPGSDQLLELVPNSMISAVNYSEAFQKALNFGNASNVLKAATANLGVDIVPFDRDMAEAAARIFEPTRGLGISFADRACLTLGKTRSLSVITSDRKWKELDIGVEVMLFRPGLN